MIAHGDCPCGGVYEQQHVTIRFEVEGKTVTLSQVLQGRCGRCGSRVYPAGTLELIETAYKGRRAATRPS